MELNNHDKGKINLNVKVNLDHYRRIIHVLEPLENTVEIDHLIRIVQETTLVDYDVKDDGTWTWFLYRKSGSVSHFSNGVHYYVPLSDIRIYPAYIGIMLMRINRQRLLG